MRDAKSFKSSSQEKSSQAQDREKVTTQPKEELFGLPKGKVTLSDVSGGLYTWTVDAYYKHDNDIHLIEMKHSKKGIPGMSDIKDALFKFHFYANIDEIKDGTTKLIPKPTLLLSSATETTNKIKRDNIKNSEYSQRFYTLQSLSSCHLTLFMSIISLLFGLPFHFAQFYTLIGIPKGKIKESQNASNSVRNYHF